MIVSLNVWSEECTAPALQKGPEHETRESPATGDGIDAVNTL